MPFFSSLTFCLIVAVVSAVFFCASVVLSCRIGMKSSSDPCSEKGGRRKAAGCVAVSAAPQAVLLALCLVGGVGRGELLLGILTCICADALLFALLVRMREEQKNDLPEALSPGRWEAMAEQNESMRKLRHDMVNHLAVLKYMVEKGKPEAADYLAKTTEEFRSAAMGYYCGCGIVNSLLYNKAVAAQNRHIRFSVTAVLDDVEGYDESALLTLLDRMLADALDAAEGAETPFVDVSILQRPANLILKVRSSIRPDAALSYGREKRTASDFLSAAAARCGGSCQTEIRNEVRETTALVCAAQPTVVPG